MPNIRVVPIIKVCPVCDTSFEVCPPGRKSRYYPPNTKVFCSRTCGHRARFRMGERCNELTVAQAAYIAGFLDGEGTIMLYMRRDAVALRVSFANCDDRPLQFIRKVAGVGNIVSKVRDNEHHRQSFLLFINSTAAYSLLKQVECFLVIKREQALLAIDFFERIKDPSLKADRSWQYEYRERLQHMNRRGPR